MTTPTSTENEAVELSPPELISSDPFTVDQHLRLTALHLAVGVLGQLTTRPGWAAARELTDFAEHLVAWLRDGTKPTA